MILSEALMLLALMVSIFALIYTLTATRRIMLQQQAYEARLAQLPSAGELADLRVQIASLEAKQGSVLNEVHATRASTRRIEDFLLRASRKADDSQF